MQVAQSDKVAIVTGASRGIGRAIALELARVGHTVCLAARDAEALNEVAAAAVEAGAPAAHPIPTDLRDADAADAVIGIARDKAGRLDILVNNAGATRRGDFLTLTDEDYLDGFALKFHGTVRLCRAAWPELARTHGSIVNISGIGAHTPTPDFTIGGPVNAAVINFSKAIAARGIADGIRVNVVCPGHVVTDRLHGRIASRAEQDAISLDDARDALRNEYGIARFGEPQEIAAVVRLLVSDECAYVHGAIVDVDGGATRGL